MNKLAYLLLLPLVAATSHLSIRPVRWKVVGGGSPLQVTSGRTVAVTLQADIAKGWHIYSLTQKPGGPIPLSIKLIDPADVIVRGVIKAPQPERAFDKNFGIETEVYSGNPRFTIPVGVPGRSLTGFRKFQVGVRYQVCSETLCLPPRTEKLPVVLQIEDRE
ncbi:MAG: protein-disulfide reductase DsbD N-terminal domain-containing protein [Gemmatimonadota bacterium]|nr:protein-disulfide reductase DsbD N-terminal domain-containing protein [Gemmatimonadota bacterium]